MAAEAELAGGDLAATATSMISDLDIYRAAKLLVTSAARTLRFVRPSERMSCLRLVISTARGFGGRSWGH
jgi:hypothetical protein